MRESDIQKKIIEYLSIIAGKNNLFFFSIPNESLMTALISFNVPENTRYKLVSHFKKLGMVSGIPDLCILWDGKCIFIEVKIPGGITTDKQKIIHNAIAQAGHAVYVVRSLEDLQIILSNEGLKL